MLHHHLSPSRITLAAAVSVALATPALIAEAETLRPALWQDLREPGGSWPWVLLANDEGLLFTPGVDGSYFIDELYWTDGSVAGTHVVPRDADAVCPGVSATEAVRDGTAVFWSIYVPFSTQVLCYADRDGWRRLARAEGFEGLAAVGPHEIYYSYEGAIYSSDGTPDGTRLRFSPDAPPWPEDLAGGDDEHLFFHLRFSDRAEVWSTDHDGRDPTLVLSLALPWGDLFAFQPIGDRSLWLLRGADGERSLWVSDGTPAGTLELASIEPQLDPLKELSQARFVEHAGRYFVPVTRADGDGFALWSTDGTRAGTERGAEIAAGTGTRPTRIRSTPAGLFLKVLGADRTEIWRSDGSAAGTWRLAEFPSLATALGEGEWLRDRWIFSGRDEESGNELWESFGTPETTRRLADLRPGPESSMPQAFGRVGDRLFFSADDGIHGGELWFVDAAASFGCPEASDLLCTGGGRFRWFAGWRDFADERGLARAAGSSDESGLLWFFHPDNLELAVKALDGGAVNERTWVFLASLTNVETSVTVVDAQVGAGRTYLKPAGRYASLGDTDALPRSPGESARPIGPSGFLAFEANQGASGVCTPTESRLCLHGGRFAVESSWRDFEGSTGSARTWPLTPDSGGLWFFAESNLEVLVKVIDGRELNGRYWVYYGALSNVEYTLTVTDTVNGTVRTYHNPAGSFASVGDNSAF